MVGFCPGLLGVVLGQPYLIRLTFLGNLRTAPDIDFSTENFHFLNIAEKRKNRTATPRVWLSWASRADHGGVLEISRRRLEGRFFFEVSNTIDFLTKKKLQGVPRKFFPQKFAPRNRHRGSPKVVWFSWACPPELNPEGLPCARAMRTELEAGHAIRLTKVIIFRK